MSDDDLDVLADQLDSGFDEGESDAEDNDGAGEQEQELRAEGQQVAALNEKKSTVGCTPQSQCGTRAHAEEEREHSQSWSFGRELERQNGAHHGRVVLIGIC